MNVKEKVRKELTEIQKVNEARRHKIFIETAKDIIRCYNENIHNFANNKEISLIEFARPYFPSSEFQILVDEGVFNADANH